MEMGEKETSKQGKYDRKEHPVPDDGHANSMKGANDT